MPKLTITHLVAAFVGGFIVALSLPLMFALGKLVGADERFMLSSSAMGLAAVLMGGAIHLLNQQRRDPDKGVLEVVLPIIGKVRTKSIPVLMLLLAFVLIFYPMFTLFSAPQRLPVSGVVKIEGEHDHAGIMVGVVPNTSQAWTRSDGTVDLNVAEDSLPVAVVAYATMRSTDASGASVTTRLVNVGTLEEKGDEWVFNLTLKPR